MARPVHASAPLALLLAAALLCGCNPGAPSPSAPTAADTPSTQAPSSSAPVPPSPLLATVLTGRVTGAGGAPVEGAIVRVRGEDSSVRTGPDGRFVLATRRLLPLVVAAAKDAHFTGQATANDSATPLLISLEPVWTTDNPNYRFLEATECASCHGTNYADWYQSPHSRAGTNQWVLDVYDGSGTPGGAGGFVYRRDSIQLPHSPAGRCADCHQPARAARAPGRTFMAPPSDPEAREGVTCDVCHKTWDLDLDKIAWPGVDPAQMKMRRPAGDGHSHPLIFGGLGDATFASGPMRPAYSAMMADGSALCAACHEDALDANHNGRYDDPEDIPSESTYSEWAASPYASGPKRHTCVDCHMKNERSRTTFCNFQAVPRGPHRLRDHTFEGTSPERIRSAVEMRMQVARLPGGRRIQVDVEIENTGAGHHFPTGASVRNALLKVEALRDGRPLRLLHGPRLDEVAGSGDPARGDLAGLPGRLFARVYEDRSGRIGVFYTEARRIAYDTRIPAKEKDRSRYVFLAPHGGDIEVRAVLLYRRAYRELVKAKGWTRDGHGRPLADVEPPHFGLLVAEATERIRLP